MFVAVSMQVSFFYFIYTLFVMYHKSFAAIRIYLPEIIIEKIRTLFKGQSYDLRFKFSNLFMFSMINRTCETSCL